MLNSPRPVVQDAVRTTVPVTIWCPSCADIMFSANSRCSRMLTHSRCNRWRQNTVLEILGELHGALATPICRLISRIHRRTTASANGHTGAHRRRGKCHASDPPCVPFSGALGVYRFKSLPARAEVKSLLLRSVLRGIDGTPAQALPSTRPRGADPQHAVEPSTTSA